MPRRNRCVGSCRSSRDAWQGTSAGWAPGTSGPVLGGDRSRGIERERCGRGGCLAEHWCPVVPEGWRDAASHPRAGVGALSVVCGAGGDRGPARWWLWGARDRASAGSGAVDYLPGAATQRCGPHRPAEYRASTAQTHADRRARRPKPAKLAVNPELRALCAGPPCRGCAAARRERCGSAGRLAGAASWTAKGPALGDSHGVRSRSPVGFALTSPMMSRCGSLTRRSISRSICRAAERCAES